LPKGRVTVTDLSDRMLEVAAENAARRGVKNFQTRQCDAGALPFPDNSFDAVLCRFGFMFFPDVDLSMKEFARVAKRGARICTAVWDVPDKNPWATTIMGTISKHVEMPTPPLGSPGLFCCAAPGYMPGFRWEIGVSREGRAVMSVKIRPRPKDSGLEAREASWRKSKTAEPSDNILERSVRDTSGCNVQ
jgi:SAM-dependent methyltransferase